MKKIEVDIIKLKRGDRTSYPGVIEIICIGDLKNQDILIKAIHKMKEEIHLTLIGSRSEGCRRLVKELRIKSKVEILDSVAPSEIPNYYSNSDIFAVVANDINNYTPLVEAMASSLPIVTTTNPFVTDLVEDGGIFVDANPEEFRKAFKFLIEHPEIRAEIGLRGRLKSIDFGSEII